MKPHQFAIFLRRMQARGKRPHDEIGGASSATIVTWFDVIPRDICTGIATSMHPRNLPLLVAVGIVRLPAFERGDAAKRRIAYDVRLMEWLSSMLLDPMALLRQYASCRELVPSVDARRTMCTMMLEASYEHNPDPQICVAATLVPAIYAHNDDIVDVCMPLENMSTYQDIENCWTIGAVAVLASNQHALETMIAIGVDINAEIDEDGDSLLMIAVQFGRESMVRFLLDKGASIAESALLLLYAAGADNGYTIAKLLIDRGVDINARTPPPMRPVLARLIRTNSAMARLLLVHGASIAPVYINGQMHWSPLFSSINADDEEMTALLIALGADPSDVFQRYECLDVIEHISDSHRALLARALGDVYV